MAIYCFEHNLFFIVGANMQWFGPKNVFSLQFIMLTVSVSKLYKRDRETHNKLFACVSLWSITGLHLMENETRSKDFDGKRE